MEELWTRVLVGDHSGKRSLASWGDLKVFLLWHLLPWHKSPTSRNAFLVFHSRPRDCRWFALTNTAENTRLRCDVLCFSCEMHCFYNSWCSVLSGLCLVLCLCGTKGSCLQWAGTFWFFRDGRMQDGGASDVLGGSLRFWLNDGSSKWTTKISVYKLRET